VLLTQFATTLFLLDFLPAPQYCWVHPEKEAAIQCILCLRCKVRIALSDRASNAS